MISMLEKFLSFGECNNSSATDVKMDRSVLAEKSSFMILGPIFSTKLNWGSYIAPIAKNTSKKI